MSLQKATLAQGYDRSALLYDELVGPSYVAGVRRLLSQFPVPTGASILDVGTGTGIALFEALQQSGRPSLAIGVDIAPNMVMRAISKAASLGLPARFLVADAEHLPFPDMTFDVVICSSAFHWFTDRLQAAREMLRVLKPGGRLLLVSASAPCGWEWFEAMVIAARLLIGRADALEIPNLPSPFEVAATLAAAGFHVAAANPSTHRTPMDPQRMTALMSLVVPNWNAKMDPLTSARVVELGNRILAGNRSVATAPYTWSAIEIAAMRPPMPVTGQRR